MKLLLFAAIVITLISCSKDSSSDRIPITSTTAKLKRITHSLVGTRIADIIEVEYDASNRVTKWYCRTEDSSFTPIKVKSRSTNDFYYTGSSNTPYKDSVFDIVYPGSGSSFTNNFTYNAQGNLLKEESIHGKNEYEYNSSWLIKKEYSLSGAIYTMDYLDSISFDANGKIITYRQHDLASSELNIYTYNYDTRQNPFASLNISKTPIAYSGTVIAFDEHYRSLNNVLNYQGQFGSTPSYFENEALTYVYDSNGFPISGTSSWTYSPGIPNENYTIKFEYY